jgi:predicted DNA-binding transcriptional regulator AlpA
VTNDDLVTIGEAADELGMIRQTLYMRAVRNPVSFPAPVVEGRTVRLYSMREVARWNEGYEKRREGM